MRPVETTIPNDLLRPSQAAQLLGLHIGTIYRWINDGTLPKWLMGKQVRVRQADVEAQVRRGQPKPVQGFTKRGRAERAAWTREVLEKNGISV